MSAISSIAGDVPGFDLTSNNPLDAPDAQTCSNDCNGNTDCMWATFNSATNKCFMKKGVPNAQINTGMKNFGAGASVYTKYSGVDIPGFDLGSFPIIPDENACSALCTANPLCTWYNYNPTSKMCWIKTPSATANALTIIKPVVLPSSGSTAPVSGSTTPTNSSTSTATTTTGLSTGAIVGIVIAVIVVIAIIIGAVMYSKSKKSSKKGHKKSRDIDEFMDNEMTDSNPLVSFGKSYSLPIIIALVVVGIVIAYSKKSSKSLTNNDMIMLQRTMANANNVTNQNSYIKQRRYNNQYMC